MCQEAYLWAVNLGSVPENSTGVSGLPPGTCLECQLVERCGDKGWRCSRLGKDGPTSGYLILYWLNSGAIVFLTQKGMKSWLLDAFRMLQQAFWHTAHWATQDWAAPLKLFLKKRNCCRNTAKCLNHSNHCFFIERSWCFIIQNYLGAKMRQRNNKSLHIRNALKDGQGCMNNDCHCNTLPPCSQ